VDVVVDVVCRDVAADALDAGPRVVAGPVGQAIVAELSLVLRGGLSVAGGQEREDGQRRQQEETLVHDHLLIEKHGPQEV
jgi:hypothetical protein